MTPEEKAVIDAAIEANQIGPEPTVAQLNILRTAVHRLIFACPECNAGGHTCPGDGDPISHTQTNCGKHSADPLPGESEPPIKGFADETVIQKAHEFYGDEMYPPAETPIHAGANGECPDYGSRLDPCPPGCASGTCVANQRPPEWLLARMTDCLAGDRIRLQGEETTVISTSLEQWHAKNREYPRHDGKTGDHQTRWDHLELRMRLEAIPELTQYPTDVAIEILCTPERKAALLLQQAFPGSVDI